MLALLTLCRLLNHKHVLGGFEDIEIAETFVVEISQFHIIFQVYLVQEVVADEGLLLLNPLVFLVQHFISLLWSEVRLIVEPLDHVRL